MWSTQVIGTLLILMLVAMGEQAAGGESGQGPPTIQIEHAWVQRIPPMAQVEQGSHGGSTLNPEQSALYVTVRNDGREPDALLAVSSEVATTGELHQTVLQEGTMVMQPQTRFDIPAGGRLEMQVGGAHMMLLGLIQALRAGETVQVTLTFQQAGPMSIEAVVK
jgi:copper(I)-binding protein